MPKHPDPRGEKPARAVCGQLSYLACLLALLLATLGASAQTTINVPAQQPTIQAGINAANNGDTVLVAAGTYKENINFNGKAITVVSASGAVSTTIQGDGTTAVVLFANNENRSSVLNGFTITGGGTIPLPADYGGGVYIQGASPTILNNNIINNPCHGVDVEFSGPLIQGNTISGTDSNGVNFGYCNFEGNGILLIGSSYSTHYPEVIGNTIVNNQHAVQYDGGGIELWDAEGSVIESNVIANNATTGQGGGIVSYNTDAMIIAQNLIYGNHAQYGAAGISILAPGPDLEPFVGLIQDNTLAGNVVANGGSQDGGPGASQVYLEGGLGAYELTDNIIAGNDSNAAFTCGETYNYLSLTPLVVDHNNIYNPSGPAYGGACSDQTGQYGNISADPLFKDAATNDYHLLTGSPAIDSGNNSALELLLQPPVPSFPGIVVFPSVPLLTDLDGNPRVVDVTGKGYPVVDMGAYEVQMKNPPAEPQPTTIVLNPSSYEPQAGQTLTLTANLYSPSGTPTGTVTFFEDGTQIGTATIDSTGAATLTPHDLVSGTHAFLATYAGQGGFPPCESVKIYIIVPLTGVTISIISTPNPSLLGQSVTFTVNSTAADGTHPGPVTLTDTTTNTTLATLTPGANGNATYTTSALPVGNNAITASYPGNSTYESASASLVQVVNGSLSSTSTTLTASPNPAYALRTVALTAKVTTTATGTPAGTVTFYDSGAALGTAILPASGIVTLPVQFAVASATPHQLTAVYSGDSSFSPSTSAPFAETILFNPTTTVIASIAPNPVGAFLNTTLTAKVSSTTGPVSAAMGTVVFTTGGTTLGAATLTNGTASVEINAGAAGTYPVIATYSGDTAFSTSHSAAATLTVTKEPSTVTLKSSLNPSVFGDAVTFTAVESNPGQSAGGGGTFTFYDGRTVLGTPRTPGISSTELTISTLAVGTHAITAVYSGNASVNGSTSSVLDQVVLAYAGDFTLTATPDSAKFYTGESAKFTVTATPEKGFNLPLALSCAGLPANAICTFTPATITDGAYQSTLVIQTAAPSAKTSSSRWTGGTAALACLCGLLMVPRRIRNRLRARSILIGAILLGAFAAISGCGGPGSITGGTPPGTYEIKVIAQTTTVAPQLSHSAKITLGVKSLF